VILKKKKPAVQEKVEEGPGIKETTPTEPISEPTSTMTVEEPKKINQQLLYTNRFSTHISTDKPIYKYLTSFYNPQTWRYNPL
jgi:hypothetical protein